MGGSGIRSRSWRARGRRGSSTGEQRLASRPNGTGGQFRYSLSPSQAWVNDESPPTTQAWGIDYNLSPTGDSHEPGKPPGRCGNGGQWPPDWITRRAEARRHRFAMVLSLPASRGSLVKAPPGLARKRRAVQFGLLDLGLSLSRPSTGLRHAVCAWSFYAPTNLAQSYAIYEFTEIRSTPGRDLCLSAGSSCRPRGWLGPLTGGRPAAGWDGLPKKLWSKRA